MNVLNSQNAISKIINIYAEREEKTLQKYLFHLFNDIMDDISQTNWNPETSKLIIIYPKLGNQSLFKLFGFLWSNYKFYSATMSIGGF
jgi:hypothetical protein